MNRARGSTCSRSPGRQKKRHRSSKPWGAPSSSAVTFGSAARGRKLVNAPSAFSTASLSILPRSAASTIGTGSAGGCSSLKPVDVRSPENAARRNSSVCDILVSGLANGIWFQPSTIRSEEAPMPEHEPAVAGVRQGGRLLGQQGRPAGEDADHAGAEPCPLGPGRGQRQRREAIGPVASRRSTGPCTRRPRRGAPARACSRRGRFGSGSVRPQRLTT